MNRKSIVLLVLILCLLIFASSCTTGLTPSNDPELIKQASISGSIDYGNGVYYFECQYANFGKSLAYFRESHPELVQESMCVGDTTPHGRPLGYWVTFRKKYPQEKQEQ